MEKLLVYQFIKWLEDKNTTTEEILKHKEVVKEALIQLTEDDMRREVQYALRLINEELVDRLGVLPNQKRN